MSSSSMRDAAMQLLNRSQMISMSMVDAMLTAARLAVGVVNLFSGEVEGR